MKGAAPVRASLHRRGEFWTVGIGARTFHLRASKGLAYIARLLQNPGAQIHVLDLVRQERDGGADSPHDAPASALADDDALTVGGLGDAGPLLDARSKAAYRQRLGQLRGEFTSARERGDAAAADRVEEEMDALTRELSRAVGRGGRERRASSASERARLSVNKAIAYTIEKMRQQDAALAQELGRGIRTGTFCSYVADPSRSLVWEVDRYMPAVDGDKQETSTLAIFQKPCTDFVGREDECDRLAEAFRVAANGDGSIALLSGGAGVGKTRIAIEAARRAASRGAVVLFGACREQEQQHPFFPLADLVEMAMAQTAGPDAFRQALGDNAADLAQIVPGLRRQFPDLPATVVLPPEHARRWQLDTTCGFLKRCSEARPVFMIIDDLHWADESTLALMSHLPGRLNGTPILIVGTFRDAEPKANGAFERALEQMIRAGIRPMRVKGLQRSAVDQMIGALAGDKPPPQLVDTIYRETGGNPFFVEEVFRCLQEEGRIRDPAGAWAANFEIGEIEVPESVRLVVGRRLKHLTAQARRVLSAAAAIGLDFDFGMLEAIAPVRGETLLDSLEELLKSGLVLAAGNGGSTEFSFSHELVRQTVLSEIAGPRRRRLHHDLARALIKAFPDDEGDHAAEIVHHLLLAESEADAATIGRYLNLAGKYALRQAAFDEASRYFALGRERSGVLELKECAELLANSGMAERSLGRWDEALRLWREALELYWSASDRQAYGDLAVAAVETLGWTERYQSAFQLAMEAEQKLHGERSTHRARMLAMIGGVQAFAGLQEPAEHALGEAIAIATESGDSRTLGEVLSYRVLFHGLFLRYTQALADGARSAELLRATNAWWSLAQLLTMLQNITFQVGDLDESDRIASELESLALRIGHDVARVVCARSRARCEFSRTGNLDRLCSHIRSEFNERVTGAQLEPTQSVLAQGEFLKGNWDVALALCEQVYGADRPQVVASLGDGLLFRQMAYVGKREQALALLEKRKGLLPRGESPATVGAWRFLLLVVDGLFALGGRERIAQLYGACRSLAQGRVRHLAGCSPHAMAGVAAAAAGDWPNAEQFFAEARDDAEQMPDRLLQADVRRLHATVLIDWGSPEDRDRSRTMLKEALGRYTQMGMRRHAEIVKHHLW